MTAILLLCLAAGGNPEGDGPHPVGVTTAEFRDAKRNGRLLKTEIWYPADPASAAAKKAEPKPPSLVKTVAARDAVPAKGKFPWVVFSHGLFAVREQSTFVTEHLASHGFVVVAPDHPSTSARDFRPSEILQSGMDRPGDMTALASWMLQRSADPSDRFHGRLDAEKLAVMGHSFGGYTALAVGGAVVSAKELHTRFPNHSYVGERDFRDERFKCVVAYAPLCRPAFLPETLARCKTPTLVFAATIDESCPLEKHQLPIFEHLAGPRYLAIIDGGSHYTFNNEELSRLVAMVKNKKQPTITRDESDPMVRSVTLAFLHRHLLGSEQYAEEFDRSRPRLEIRRKAVAAQPESASR